MKDRRIPGAAYVLVVTDKYSTRYYDATGDNLYDAAYKIFKARYDEGYWYSDGDTADFDLELIIETRNGTAAWEFLDFRTDYQYEGVQLERLL